MKQNKFFFFYEIKIDVFDFITQKEERIEKILIKYTNQKKQ